jgi:hypothetical protein
MRKTHVHPGSGAVASRLTAALGLALLLVIPGLAACSNKKKDQCQAAYALVVELATAKLQAAGKGVDAAKLNSPEGKAAFVVKCMDWSDAEVACLDKAKVSSPECQSLLKKQPQVSPLLNQ